MSVHALALQVWYLSPADADCVGVLRYHVVPDPTLAPEVSPVCLCRPSRCVS